MIRKILIGLVIIFVVLTRAFLFLNKNNGQIETAGRVRKYLLYVPESYDSSSPTPLVISIHGFIEWPAHQKTLSGWNTLADENGFIVVYPQGTGFPFRWNSQPTGGNPNKFIEEVKFFSNLIDALSQEYNIDPSRIYANGMSNGGGMSYALACELSDRIAAIGGVAGSYLYPWESCHPPRPVPVIAFHGKKDTIVPYHGESTISQNHKNEHPQIEEWVSNWAGHNGCDVKPEVIPTTGEVSGVRYTTCDENVEVLLYTVDGGGHTWPGGDPLPKWIAGHTTQDINATDLMWKFFSKYSLEQ